MEQHNIQAGQTNSSVKKYFSSLRKERKKKNEDKKNKRKSEGK